MSAGKLVAKPHAADSSVKTTRPATQTGLRPIASESRPNVSNSAAITTRYAVTTHSTAPLSSAPKVRAIAGRLMLTIEESSVVLKVPTAAERRDSPAAELGIGRVTLGAWASDWCDRRSLFFCFKPGVQAASTQQSATGA